MTWSIRIFVIFSMCWLAFVAISFMLAQMDDCSYIQTEACKAFMHYEPRLILWRGAAIELAAALFFVWFRKR